MFAATVAVTVMSGVLLASVGAIARQEVGRSTAASSERANAALASLVKHRQEKHLADARMLAGLPVLSAAVLTKDVASVEEVTKRYRYMVGSGWLVLTDSDGNYLGGMGPEGRDVGHWSPDQSALAARTGRPLQGNLAIDGRLAMASTVPVALDGSNVGALTIATPVDDGFAKEIADSARTDIAFVTKGRVLGSSVPMDLAGPFDAQRPEVNVDGQTYAVSARVLPDEWGGVPLSFISLYDTSKVDGAFHAIQRVLALVFGGSVMAALLMGYTLADRLTRPLEDLVASARELQAGRWPDPTPTKRRDEIGLLQTVFDETVVSLRDSQESLLQMMQVDPLTRLLNHNTFRDRLASEVFAAQAAGRQMSLVLIDLDNFEEFNVDRGREEGDVALVTVADILRQWAGATGCAARFGGNEFAVLCPDVTADETLDRVSQVLEEIFVRTGVTASAGVAPHTSSTARPDLLVLAANLAVQQAKLAGKNRCRVYAGDVTSASPDDLKSFLQGGSYAAVRALAEAVDAKDQYTRGHSQRVAEYARDLARAAGYDDGFVELVFTTGTLHDVGKIGVPDHVLHKEGRLTDEEFDLVKMHPELGEKIVSQIATLHETLPGIRHHHERYDGKGYPDGLAGEDVPLIARILAVADTYDAMTSDRPYRRGMPVEAALDEIVMNAGTQFDPDLASLFVLLRRRELAA